MMTKPKHAKRKYRNAEGALVDHGLPGWAVHKMFALQEQLENALPWERAELQRKLDHLIKVEVPKWESEQHDDT